jgi:hypothetical protein
MKIEKKEVETIKEKKPIPHETIVYCKGNAGVGSFYGIVCIRTNEPFYLGDTVNFWTIEKICNSVQYYM